MERQGFRYREKWCLGLALMLSIDVHDRTTQLSSVLTQLDPDPREEYIPSVRGSASVAAAAAAAAGAAAVVVLAVKLCSLPVASARAQRRPRYATQQKPLKFHMCSPPGFFATWCDQVSDFKWFSLRLSDGLFSHCTPKNAGAIYRPSAFCVCKKLFIRGLRIMGRVFVLYPTFLCGRCSKGSAL